MEQRNIAILKEMRQTIADHSNGDLGILAERLLWLRDELTFDDSAWYHELTQQVATLDSGSTFHPANNAERLQLEVVVREAASEITRLTDVKLV